MTWSKSPELFVDEVIKETGETVKQASNDFLTALVQKAPVDTSRFVSNINVSIDTPDNSYDVNKKTGRAGALAKGKAVIDGMDTKKLHSVYIVDTTPYGVYLEAGYSRQAVNGVFYPVFMGVSIWYR